MAPPLAGSTHDLTIADSDGATNLRGFMLMRDRRGNRSFVLQDAQTIAPRQLTMGELTAAEFPPDIELTWFQEDWRAGIGGQNHRLHPKQLGSSLRIDATVEGRLRLAREITVTTFDLTPTDFYPSGFGVYGSEVWAFIGTYPFIWDYANKNWDRRTRPSTSNDIIGRGVTPFDQVTYVARWGGNYTPTSDYPCRYWFKNSVGDTWTVATIRPSCFKYFGVGGGVLWGGYSADDSALNASEDLDATETDLLISGAAAGIIAVGDLIQIRQGADNPFSELMLVTAVNVGPNSLTIVRGYAGTTAEAIASNGQDIFIVGPHLVNSSSGATNSGTWASATAVGDPSAEITALVGTGATLLVCKTDGLYRIEEDGTVTELQPSLKAIRHPDNFRGAFLGVDNRVILPLGAGGMLELDLDTWTIRDISFLKTMPELTQFHGRVVAGTTEPEKVYVMVRNGLDYHILMGQWASLGGEADYRWHHLATITATANSTPTYAAMFAEGIPSGATVHHRVWAGVRSTGSNLMPYFIPGLNDVDDAYTDGADPEAVTVEWDKNLPRVLARFQSVTFVTANLGVTAGTHHQIEVQYRVDGGAWTYVTGAQASSTLTTSPQTLNFAAGVTGRILELRALPDRGTTATTGPEIISFSVRAALRPADLQLIPLSLHLSDNQRLLNGAIAGTPILDLAQIRTWNSAAAEVVLVDPAGVSHTALFLPGRMKVTELPREWGRRASYQVDLWLAEVA